MASKYFYEAIASLKESASDPASRPVPVVLAVATGSLGVWFLWSKWQNKNKKLPPSPGGWPVLGNMLDLSEEIHLDWIRLQNKYKLPDVYTLNIGPGHKMIVLNSYDAIKDALVTQGDLFSERVPSVFLEAMKLHDDVFNKNFSDPDFKANKMFVLSALRSAGFGNTKSAEEKILGQVDLLVDSLEPFIKNKEAVDLSGVFEKATGNVIYEILFNKRRNHDDPDLVHFVQVIKVWYKALMDVYMIDMLPRWLTNLFMKKTVKHSLACTDDLRSIISEELKAHLDSFDAENPRDFIDIYLAKREGKVDVEKLTNTCVLFMPDAIDTMSCFLSWIVLYTTAHPATMKRMQDEMEKVTGGNRQVTMSDRPNLPFVEAVIMEISRVACPVTMTALHCSAKDTRFRGYFIPKGVGIICNLYAAMRDPKMFERPDEFNPDRFLDKEGKLMRSEAWIPFGMGSRKCAGEQLTKTELFLFTANLFQMYDISFAEESATPSFKKEKSRLGPEPYKVILKPRA